MIKCKICNKILKCGGSHFFYKHDLSILDYVVFYEKIDIISLYNDGFSAKQIVSKIKEIKINTTKKDVLDFLDQKGIKRRNTSEAIKEWSKKRNGPWNKGLTKFDHPSILAYAESRRGDNNPVHKIKDKEKWRENCRVAFANQKTFDYVSSSLEITIGKVLKLLGIQFITQFNVGNYFYDFYLPLEKIIIEVNGTYWHCDPRTYQENYYNQRSEKTAKETWECDEKKKMLAENNGFVVKYIWEKEIKIKTIDELKSYVIEIIQNTENTKNKNR